MAASIPNPFPIATSTGEKVEGAGFRFRLPSITWIIIGAVALRFIAMQLRPKGVEIDGLGYWTMAFNWTEGRGFVDNLGNRAFLNSGYALFLAPLFAIFGSGLAIPIYANLLLCAISVWLCHRFGRLLGGETVGRVSSIFWALYIPSIAYSTLLAKENLQVPLVMGIACAGWVWMRPQGSGRWAFVTGLLSGGIALTGTTGVIFGLVFLACKCWQMRKGLAFVRPAALWVLGLFVVISPWLWRNQLVLGAPVLNTNSGLNLLLGNRAEATLGYSGLEGTDFQAQWTEVRLSEGELAVDRLARSRAMDYIQEHPGLTVQRMARRSIAFWAPPALSPIELGQVEWAFRWVWLIQYLILLLASLMAWKQPRRAAPVWGLLGAYCLAHTPFFVMARFLLPAMPLTCALAALVVVRGVQMTQKPKTTQA